MPSYERAPALRADREQAELQAYLGTDYRESSLHDYEGVLDAELDSVGDEAELYRTSRAYLYNLTAFAMTGTKLPYLRMLTETVPPGSRVLDYGCGIGSDGLLLLEMGYRVEFADFANPSTEYLRWRLERRGFDAPIHDLDRHVPGGFDLMYAFDVIEHVPDALRVSWPRWSARARLVEVNLLEFDPTSRRSTTGCRCAGFFSGGPTWSRAVPDPPWKLACRDLQP